MVETSQRPVRRAREGPLEDLPRRPKRGPRRTRREFEGLIVAEAKGTGYRYLRLHHYLLRKYFRDLTLDWWILDKKGLPGEVYEHIKGHGLPIYQWTLIDVATRARFLAYSWELSGPLGRCF